MATDKEKTAASRVNRIADWNKESANIGLEWNNALFDAADAQNKALLDTQERQYRQKADADRFQAQRNLLNATRGLNNTVGNGLAGSAAFNIANLAAGQQDANNVDYWTTLKQNLNTADNAYQESLNQNYINRAKEAIDTELAKRDIEGNQSASLNNISQDLWVDPSSHAGYSAKTHGYTTGSYTTRENALAQADEKKKEADNRLPLSTYTTSDPTNTIATRANNGTRTQLNDYFSRLLRR